MFEALNRVKSLLSKGPQDPETAQPDISPTSAANATPARHRQAPSLDERRLLAGNYHIPSDARPILLPRPDPHIDGDWKVKLAGPSMARAKVTAGSLHRPMNTLDQPTVPQMKSSAGDRKRQFESFAQIDRQRMRGHFESPHAIKDSVRRSKVGDGYTRDERDIGSKRIRLDHVVPRKGGLESPIDIEDGDDEDIGPPVARNGHEIFPRLPIHNSGSSSRTKERMHGFIGNDELRRIDERIKPKKVNKRKRTGDDRRVSQQTSISGTSSVTETPLPLRMELSHVSIASDPSASSNTLVEDRHVDSVPNTIPIPPPVEPKSPTERDERTTKRRGSNEEIARVNSVLKNAGSHTAKDPQRTVQTGKPAEKRTIPQTDTSKTFFFPRVGERASSPKLSATFKRDVPDMPNSPVRENRKRASPTRKSLSDEDEMLFGPATVASQSSRSGSPQKSAAAGSSMSQQSGERGPSPSDLKQTPFRRLPATAATAPRNIETADDAEISFVFPVDEFYCMTCVVREAELVWNERLCGFSVRKDHKPLLIPGSDAPVSIGRRDLKEWITAKGRSLLSVYIKGSSTMSTNGNMVICFSSRASLDDVYGLVTAKDDVKTTSIDFDKFEAIVSRKKQDIEEAYRRKVSASSRSKTATATAVTELAAIRRRQQYPSLDDDDERIKYDSDEPQQPRGPTTRERMIAKTAAESSGRRVLRAPLAMESTVSPYFGESRRSSRVSKPREKTPPRLSPERWTKVNNPKRWSQPVTYPPEGKERVTVEFEDLERLDEGEFLNDNVIAFALRRIQEKMAPEHREKVYFFNSFFYTGLMHRSGRKRFDYDAVKRWTKNKDILSYPYIVVPINLDLHWFVAIICNLPNIQRRAEGLDDDDASATQDSGPTVPVQENSERQTVEVADSQEERDLEMTDAAAGIEDSRNEPMEIDARHRSMVAVVISPPRSPQHYEKQTSIDLDATELSLCDQDDAKVAAGTGATDIPPDEAGSRPSTSSGKKGKKRPPPPRPVDPDAPAIISLDSFGLARHAEIKNLKLYVQAEARDKRAMTINIDELRGVTAKGIPGQKNFSDCGVYMIAYIEEFAKDPTKFVTRVLTRQIEESALKTFDAPKKREEIRDALLDLAGTK